MLVPLSGFAGKLNAIHSVWHHDIAEQEVKFLATLEHLDGLRTIPGAKHPIAERGQHCGRGFQEILIVLDHKDSLGPAGMACVWTASTSASAVCVGSRQVQSDRGSRAGRTFYGYMPTGLPDEAIDHAEAEAGALADFLGREEGLKNPIPYFGRHPGAVVRDGQPDIRSGHAPGHGSLVQDDVPRLDLEHAAIRHGVAPVQGQVEESGLQQRRIDVAQPQSLIGPQPDLASSPTAWRMSPWNSEISSFALTSFGLQFLPPGKGEKLRRQLLLPDQRHAVRPRRTAGPCHYPPHLR